MFSAAPTNVNFCRMADGGYGRQTDPPSASKPSPSPHVDPVGVTIVKP
jgi:hypothetical protein